MSHELDTTKEFPIGRTDTSWMKFAICHGKTDLFFPKVAERPQARVRRERLAATLCRACPVSAECREYGRETREYGFWGGENEIERHLAGFSLPAAIGLRHLPESQKI
jgi:WhiB family redox-sensing transcriptional regulator